MNMKMILIFVFGSAPRVKPAAAARAPLNNGAGGGREPISAPRGGEHSRVSSSAIGGGRGRSRFTWRPRRETMTIPEIRYAKSGDVHLAYQVVGDAPRDLVLVPGWVSHLEYEWEEPHFSRFLRRLA